MAEVTVIMTLDNGWVVNHHAKSKQAAEQKLLNEGTQTQELLAVNPTEQHVLPLE